MSREKRDDVAWLDASRDFWDTTDAELGYVSRVFAQTSLPYKDPGNVPAWGRRNGRIALVVTPGMDIDEHNQPVSIGYPFGVMPRLLLTWLTTEAVRTRCPDLVLGDSLADFLRQLGLDTGGYNGRRLKDSMRRLFRSQIVVTYDDTSRSAGAQMGVADQWNLFWSDRDRAERFLVPSTVRLSSEFFREATERPVPVSIDALRHLAGSPMRLDIYSWLTYRMSRVTRKTQIPWDALLVQFGGTVTTKQARHKFKHDFTLHLARVMAVYPSARVDVHTEGIVLLPSPTHIAPKAERAAAQAARRAPMLNLVPPPD